MKRWWIFLGERFPLVSHTLMIASFTLANMAFGLTIYPPAGAEGLIASVEWTRMFIAFFVALSFFLRLRLFDEI
ncbi:MAG: hypothetical protein ABIR96_02105, partial [Bdellovibrionota bacterium]